MQGAEFISQNDCLSTKTEYRGSVDRCLNFGGFRENLALKTNQRWPHLKIQGNDANRTQKREKKQQNVLFQLEGLICFPY